MFPSLSAYINTRGFAGPQHPLFPSLVDIIWHESWKASSYPDLLVRPTLRSIRWPAHFTVDTTSIPWKNAFLVPPQSLSRLSVPQDLSDASLRELVLGGLLSLKQLTHISLPSLILQEIRVLQHLTSLSSLTSLTVSYVGHDPIPPPPSGDVPRFSYLRDLCITIADGHAENPPPFMQYYLDPTSPLISFALSFRRPAAPFPSGTLSLIEHRLRLLPPLAPLTGLSITFSNLSLYPHDPAYDDARSLRHPPTTLSDLLPALAAPPLTGLRALRVEHDAYPVPASDAALAALRTVLPQLERLSLCAPRTRRYDASPLAHAHFPTLGGLCALAHLRAVRVPVRSVFLIPPGTWAVPPDPVAPSAPQAGPSALAEDGRRGAELRTHTLGLWATPLDPEYDALAGPDACGAAVQHPSPEDVAAFLAGAFPRVSAFRVVLPIDASGRDDDARGWTAVVDALAGVLDPAGEKRYVDRHCRESGAVC